MEPVALINHALHTFAARHGISAVGAYNENIDCYFAFHTTHFIC